jgi:hypothetical protein
MYDVCITKCACYMSRVRARKYGAKETIETKRLILQGVVQFERASANSEASIMSTLNHLHTYNADTRQARTVSAGP